METTKQKFKIMARYPGCDAEQIDEADNKNDADDLIRGWRSEFGKEWKIWARPV